MAKKHLQCQSCLCDIVKNDARFVDEDTFAFLKQLPPGVALGIYCVPCFDSQVQPELDIYKEKMELAKNVNVFFATQNKETRFVRRLEKPIQVDDCDDRDEVLLRLAFRAVEINKNGLVDVDLSSEKVRNGGWQSSRWSGRAVPVDIAESDLQRKFIGAPN